MNINKTLLISPISVQLQKIKTYFVPPTVSLLQVPFPLLLQTIAVLLPSYPRRSLMWTRRVLVRRLDLRDGGRDYWMIATCYSRHRLCFTRPDRLLRIWSRKTGSTDAQIKAFSIEFIVVIYCANISCTHCFIKLQAHSRRIRWQDEDSLSIWKDNHSSFWHPHTVG